VVEHKHLNGIHNSQVSRLGYRIVSIQVANHQIRWIKMCEKCVRSPVRKDIVRLTIDATF